MLTALAVALMLQQAAGMISWDLPIESDPNAPVATPAAPPVVLPDWALADPFAWERSQCSPIIRKDASSNKVIATTGRGRETSAPAAPASGTPGRGR